MELDRYSMENKENCRLLKSKNLKRVWELNLDNGGKYIVKFNENKMIKGEWDFYKFYNRNRYFPTIMKMDLEKDYLIYSYITGNAEHNLTKIQILKEVVLNVINNYKINDKLSGFGLLGENSSWEEYLTFKVKDAADRIGSILTEKDYYIVIDAIKELSKSRKIRKPYYLQGNCALDNVIIEDGEFKGLIDPMPTNGDPIYDMINAFCSTPDDISGKNLETLLRTLRKEFRVSKKDVFRYMVIVLYIQLGQCLTFRCAEIVNYIVLWESWKKIYKAL